MSTYPLLGLIDLLRGLERQGMDTQALLRRHDLDPAQLQPDTRLDTRTVLQLLEDIRPHLPSPSAGLHLGRNLSLAGQGPLVRLLLTSADGEQALRLAVHYQPLSLLVSSLQCQPGEQDSALVLQPPPLPEDTLRPLVDIEVAGLVKLLQDLGQLGLIGPLPLRRIDLPYARPWQAGEYSDHFGCPVQFNTAVARLWLDNRALRQPLPQADRMAHRLYRAQCDLRLLELQRQQAPSLARQVRDHLLRFRDEYPSAPEVAATLGMSERTLRRQLSAEGGSFRQLLNQVRQQQACQLLRTTTMTVEQLARQMGYSEPASFIRAFQRWHGMTPLTYRRQQAGSRDPMRDSPRMGSLHPS